MATSKLWESGFIENLPDLIDWLFFIRFATAQRVTGKFTSEPSAWDSHSMRYSLKIAHQDNLPGNFPRRRYSRIFWVPHSYQFSTRILSHIGCLNVKTLWYGLGRIIQSHDVQWPTRWIYIHVCTSFSVMIFKKGCSTDLHFPQALENKTASIQNLRRQTRKYLGLIS